MKNLVTDRKSDLIIGRYFEWLILYDPLTLDLLFTFTAFEYIMNPDLLGELAIECPPDELPRRRLRKYKVFVPWFTFTLMNLVSDR